MTLGEEMLQDQLLEAETLNLDLCNQVVALREEVERLKEDGEAGWDRAESHRLEAASARAEAGRLLAKADAEYNRKTNTLIERHANQLLAAQLSERKLREALGSIKIWARFRDFDEPYYTAHEALSTPTNTDEADKLIKALEVAKDAMVAINKAHDDLSDAIQSEFENGVKCLSVYAAEKFKVEYPKINQALVGLLEPTISIDDAISTINELGLTK